MAEAITTAAKAVCGRCWRSSGESTSSNAMVAIQAVDTRYTGCFGVCDADRHEHGRHCEAGHKIVPQPGRLVRAQRVPTGKPVFPASLIRLYCIAGDATRLGGLG